MHYPLKFCTSIASYTGTLDDEILFAYLHEYLNTLEELITIPNQHQKSVMKQL